MLLRLLTLICFIFIPVSIMPVTAYAANSLNQNMSHIFENCDKSPTDCLPLVNSVLKNTPVQSRIWYSLIKNKLRALYLLQKVDELYKLTSYLRTLKNMPEPLQVVVDIYHAKVLPENTNLDKDYIFKEQKKLIQRAKKSLALINDIYPDPNLLIQLANVQMYMKEYTQAYSLLKSLIIKYSDYPDLVFQFELYGTLGHLADRLGYKNKAIEYWQQSLPWALKMKNHQQIATVYFNLAQSEKTDNRLTKAQTNYHNTIKYAKLAGDQIKEAQAKIALAELLFSLNDKAAAKALIINIKSSLLPSYIAKKLITLKALM